MPFLFEVGSTMEKLAHNEINSLPLFIVTGAAGGIGKAIASEFAHSPHQYNAIFTVRNTENSNTQPLRDILVDCSKQYTIKSLELEKLNNIRSFAANVNHLVASGYYRPIRALVLNARYMSRLGQRITEDGYEKHFQVNYLANFLLVLLLLQSMDRENGRIVLISS
ncbi:hypothetical protein BCON_0142g00110 [Botryotinia convoluta]|uniref:Ketoreductase (KR) domain-containing protein n=1 Tax=Botryotinia convoluta TaxID=54673 RepID=A0A4Z1HTZ0_9HELO|nr:hypothetical protein BCON_0142g00110 [Botryotinia convoluta]